MEPGEVGSLHKIMSGVKGTDNCFDLRQPQLGEVALHHPWATRIVS